MNIGSPDSGNHQGLDRRTWLDSVLAACVIGSRFASGEVIQRSSVPSEYPHAQLVKEEEFYNIFGRTPQDPKEYGNLRAYPKKLNPEPALTVVMKNGERFTLNPQEKGYEASEAILQFLITELTGIAGTVDGNNGQPGLLDMRTAVRFEHARIDAKTRLAIKPRLDAVLMKAANRSEAVRDFFQNSDNCPVRLQCKPNQPIGVSLRFQTPKKGITPEQATIQDFRPSIFVRKQRKKMNGPIA